MKNLTALLLLLTGLNGAAAQSTASVSGMLLQTLQGRSDVQAACPPIAGVQVGDTADRATWTAQYTGNPDPACTALVANIINNIQIPPAVPLFMSIASASDPSINGSYANDTASLQQMNSISLYLVANGDFPGGTATLAWRDIIGNSHTFDASHWASFAKAMTDFVYLSNAGALVPQPTNIP